MCSCSCRGYVVRRNLRHLHTVVVPIQAMVRGVLVRTVLRHWESRVRLVQGKTLLYVKVRVPCVCQRPRICACARVREAYLCLQRKVRERNFAATAIQRIMRGVLARAHYGKKSVLDHGAASKIMRWLQRRFWYVCDNLPVGIARIVGLSVREAHVISLPFPLSPSTLLPPPPGCCKRADAWR